jgi:hypothetical protein
VMLDQLLDGQGASGSLELPRFDDPGITSSTRSLPTPAKQPTTGITFVVNYRPVWKIPAKLLSRQIHLEVSVPF